MDIDRFASYLWIDKYIVVVDKVDNIRRWDMVAEKFIGKYRINRYLNGQIISQKDYDILSNKDFCEQVFKKRKKVQIYSYQDIRWVKGDYYNGMTQILMQRCPIYITDKGQKIYFSKYLYKFMR